MQRHDVDRHDRSLGDLVSWAEAAMMDGELNANQASVISVIAVKDAELTHIV